MLKVIYSAVLILATSSVAAHEFWIEPNEMHLSPDQAMTASVRVGEDLDGMRFAFDPRAYQAALWVGPDGIEPLHTRRVSQEDLRLNPLGAGVHSLAVVSYPQRFDHTSPQAFTSFVREIGAEDALVRTPIRPAQNGTVPETYRRFSKTLVQFGSKSGQDRQLGFAYEWVQSGHSFALYAQQKTVPDHPVDLVCRQGDGAVISERLETDRTGRIAVLDSEGELCLLNTVFLKGPEVSDRWKSDWVSVLWAP